MFRASSKKFDHFSLVIVAPRHSLWRRLAKRKSGVVGGIVIVLLIVAATFGPLAAQDPNEIHLDETLSGPSPQHLFGTDQLGRDVLSRILFGARLSLVIGLVVVVISGTAGTMFGLASGYFRGFADSIIMRITDVAMAFPTLLLALLIAAVLGPGLFQTMVAVGVAHIPRFLRIARASTLSVAAREFVLAARSLGAHDWRIIRLHVLPNSLAPLIVEATLLIATSILSAASLSFLGLGINPPTPEWGNMLSDGRAYMSVAPHVVTFPGVSILITILGFNLLGDGLRDAMDVKFEG